MSKKQLKLPIEIDGMVSCTPHDIHVYPLQKATRPMAVIRHKPEVAPVLRVRSSTRPEFIEGIHIDEAQSLTLEVYEKEEWDELVDDSGNPVDVKKLCAETEEYLKIVSQPVAEYIAKYAREHMSRFVTSNTGPDGVVRDSKGRIAGTTHFNMIYSTNIPDDE